MPTIYEHQGSHVHHDQWVNMLYLPGGDEFFRGERTDKPPPDNPMLAIRLVQYYTQQAFIYRGDGISDVWGSNMQAVLDGGLFEGDCDDFAFTAALLLEMVGIPDEHIFLVTGQTWVSRLLQEARAPPYNHPTVEHMDHMFVMVWADGWWLLDNRADRVYALGDRVGEGKEYEPWTIINMANYGPGTNNDAAGGWARWWVYGD